MKFRGARVMKAESIATSHHTRPVMSVEEYIAVSGLSKATVYRGLNNGDIPGRKVRRQWVINRAKAMQQLGLA